MWFRYPAIIAVIICSLCTIRQAASKPLNEGQYIVLSGDTLRSGKDYHVAVAVSNNKEPCQLKVTLRGPALHKTETALLNTTGDMKLLKFKIPATLHGDGDYKLIAEGLAGLYFNETRKLHFKDYTDIVLIQTDTAHYERNSTIHYKLVFLDEFLRPSEPNREAALWLEDPEGKRVYEKNALFAKFSVVSGEIRVPQNVTAGKWLLRVRNGGENCTAQCDYKKPLEIVAGKMQADFQLELDAPAYFSLHTRIMRIVVRALYSKERPVNGPVNLRLERYNIEGDGGVIERNMNMVNGTAVFEIDIVENIEQWPGAPGFAVIATVVDPVTGIKQRKSTEGVVSDQKYMVTCRYSQQCNQYTPNEQSVLEYKIRYFGGPLVNDTQAPVTLRLTDANNETHSIVSHVNEFGIVRFEFVLPSSEGYDVVLEYDDQFDRTLDSIRRAPTPEELKLAIEQSDKEEELERLQWAEAEAATEATKKAEMPDILALSVTANDTYHLTAKQPFKYFHYLLTGNGDILHTERVVLSEPNNTHQFTYNFEKFTTGTPQWLYVFYVNELGVLHYAEQLLTEGTKNKLNITVPERLMPGENAEFLIRSEPGSIVHLMAVQQDGVADRNYASDISDCSIRQQLDSAAGASHLVGLTNAECVPKCPALRTEDNDATANERVTSCNGESYTETAEPWIFEQLEIGDSGVLKWQKPMPTTNSSWTISGFALHPEKMIAATVEYPKVRNFDSALIDIDIPDTIVQNQTLTVPVRVTNIHKNKQTLNILIMNWPQEYYLINQNSDMIDELSALQIETLHVVAGDTRVAHFKIYPFILGQIKIVIEVGSDLGDFVAKKYVTVIPNASKLS